MSELMFIAGFGVGLVAGFSFCIWLIATEQERSNRE